MTALQEMGWEFSEFRRIAGVTQTLAQNWTNGRPMSIRASICSASGKGTRNIYSIFDAYLLALLSMLRKSGLSTAALELMVTTFQVSQIKGFPGKFSGIREMFSPEVGWAVFTSPNSREIGMQLLPRASERPRVIQCPPDVLSLKNKVVIQVIADVAAIREEVDERARKLLRKKGEDRV